MDRVVVGCWQLAADHGSGWDRASALEALETLAREGYTTFDCADIYTGVEALLGDLRRRLGPDAALRVHTKYVPDRSTLAGLRRTDVRAAVDRSRRRLGVERLDLVQLHWWDWGVPGWLDVAGWLSDEVRAGAVAALGVTNFDLPRLRQLLAAGIDIASHQVQYSLVDRRLENGMSVLCREHGIRLLAYGSLAGGFLSDGWRGAREPGEEAGNRSLTKYRRILDEGGSWTDFQDLLAALATVAGRHRVSVAAVALRWVLERPGVAAAIVGAGAVRRLPELEAALGFSWDAEDATALERATEGRTGPAGDVYVLERVPGGPHAAILRTELNTEGR